MNNDADQKPRFFKPDDFEFLSVIYYKAPHETAAEIANAKLEKLIESWPVVYNTELKEKSQVWFWNDHNIPEVFQTHKARLAFIEPLLREPCKHEPVFKYFIDGEFSGNAKCKHCGVELVADWNAK